MTVHRTAPADAEVHASGWAPLPGGLEVTRLPLVDARYPGGRLFARLTYRDALTAAHRHGATLPTATQMDQLHLASIVLPPHPLPAGPQMTSLEWSERHDAAIWPALATWDRDVPVAGVGKSWIAGAPPGRAYLMGWWATDVSRFGSSRKGPGWVQQPSQPGSPGPHLDSHHDYGTTTLLVRPALHDTDPAPRPGAGWLASVLDGGRSVAAEAGELLRGLLQDGAAPPMPPHGWHIAVWEVVESARKAGTFVDIDDEPDLEPEPGDLMILRRGGQDPRIPGQEGHVCRIELVTPRERARVSIDGNHGNMVARVTRRRDDPEIVGYVKCRGGWGARALERAVSQLGVREATGHNDGAQIARYFVGATRGGKRTGFVPGWNWCAAFAGWSLFSEP